MSLNGIVTSDWHLGGMSKLLRNTTEKQIVEIHKPYTYAIEHSIEHIFMPGDVADTSTLSEHDLIALITLLLTYDDHISTYMILGNHDIESVKRTSCDVLRVMAENGMFKRFHLFFKPELKKIDGVNVCFMPYPHIEVLPADRPPLVFAHIETVGALGDNGRMLHMKEDTFVRQPGDFIFSGHIHQHQHLKAKRIAYCGSLYQKNFGESLPKGFIEFNAKYTASGALRVQQEFINSHPNFTLENKLINSADEWETLSKDESVRYKILVGEGVIVPKGITTEYPNIIYINGASATTKVSMDGSTVEDGGVTLRDLPTFSVSTGLTKYLKDADLNPRQIKRAKEWVREARNSLNL